jgi:hypothetical protein
VEEQVDDGMEVDRVELEVDVDLFVDSIEVCVDIEFSRVFVELGDVRMADLMAVAADAKYDEYLPRL